MASFTTQKKSDDLCLLYHQHVTTIILFQGFCFFFPESPVSVKMRIRHYFSHLSSVSSSASYDVRQGFDKQFDLIEDYDHPNRRCQTLPLHSSQAPPRKPTRVQSRSHSASRSSSVPALTNGYTNDKTKQQQQVNNSFEKNSCRQVAETCG